MVSECILAVTGILESDDINKKGIIQQMRRSGNIEVIEEKEESGVSYLTFPALERTGIVRHLCSTRAGGASEGEFATMNLSFTRGDRPEAVLENYRRIAAVLGCRLQDFVCSDQTHTCNVRVVTAADGGKGVIMEKDYTDVDGLVTNEKELVLACFFADCVPLYFVDPKKKAIGLSHSGWRGTVNRIGIKTVEKMTETFGSRPEDIVAAIGPSICGKCYEIGEDVAGEFKAAFQDRGTEKRILTEKENGKYLLDLWQANVVVMQEAGIRKENISVTDICTCCNGEKLFSHRYSHGRRGNFGAFLGLR